MWGERRQQCYFERMISMQMHAPHTQTHTPHTQHTLMFAALPFSAQFSAKKTTGSWRLHLVEVNRERRWWWWGVQEEKNSLSPSRSRLSPQGTLLIHHSFIYTQAQEDSANYLCIIDKDGSPGSRLHPALCLLLLPPFFLTPPHTHTHSIIAASFNLNCLWSRFTSRRGQI